MLVLIAVDIMKLPEGKAHSPSTLNRRTVIGVTIRSANDISAFREIVNASKGKVWMQDGKGYEYDLKSELDMYKAVGILLSDPNNDLELYASNPDTQFRLIHFLLTRMQQSA